MIQTYSRHILRRASTFVHITYSRPKCVQLYLYTYLNWHRLAYFYPSCHINYSSLFLPIFISTDALGEYMLTDIMNSNQYTGIEFAEGEDGFPAFKLLSTADVKSPYQMLLPEKLYEFAILITYRQSSLKGGYLFSVVNPLDTVVQLGVHLSPVVKNSYNVTLVYAQPDQSAGRKLASFAVAHVPDKWNSIAFQVYSDKVVFYYDCILRNTTTVVRDPFELVFASASVLYIGQAGSIIGGHFEVSSGGGQFAFTYNNYCNNRRQPAAHMSI